MGVLVLAALLFSVAVPLAFRWNELAAAAVMAGATSLSLGISIFCGSWKAEHVAMQAARTDMVCMLGGFRAPVFGRLRELRGGGDSGRVARAARDR